KGSMNNVGTCQTFPVFINRTSDVRSQSGRKSRWMNLSSVYLRRSGCLHMYNGPTLPPEATSAPGTCPAKASLYSWSAPVQLNPAICEYTYCVQGAQAGKAVVPLSSDKMRLINHPVSSPDLNLAEG